MKCNKCGEISVGNGKYCIHCGNDLTRNNEQPINNEQRYQSNNITYSNNQVSKTGTIILLILSILSGSIIGIALCAISLSNLNKASSLPEGPERESRIKTGKTCRTIALVLYIINILITIITITVSVVMFNTMKDTIDNGDTTITDGNGNVIEFENDDYIQNEEDYTYNEEQDIMVCTIDSGIAKYVYTGTFEDNKLISITGQMRIDVSDYSAEQIDMMKKNYSCADEEIALCNIEVDDNYLIMTQTVSFDEENTSLNLDSTNTLKPSTTKEMFKSVFESNSATCIGLND